MSNAFKEKNDLNVRGKTWSAKMWETRNFQVSS